MNNLIKENIKGIIAIIIIIACSVGLVFSLIDAMANRDTYEMAWVIVYYLVITNMSDDLDKG